MIERKESEKMREEDRALGWRFQERRVQKISENDKMEKGVSFYSLEKGIQMVGVDQGAWEI
jgi:hypothetical protein